MKSGALIALMAMSLVFAGCSKKTAKIEPPNPTGNSSDTGNNPGNTSGNSGNTGGNTGSSGDNSTFIYSTVYFDYDDATLSDQARNILSATGAHLQKSPDKVTIEGHCDERGSVEYNLALGEHRAGAVKDYLVSYGIRGDLLSTVSFGKERPADPGHDESAWGKNRRAEFRVNR